MKKIVVIGVIWLIWMCSFSVMAAEPVKIAAIFSKTGIAVSHNAPHIQVVELAVEEINNQGGLLGRPIELIIIDNKSSPIGSSMAAKKASSTSGAGSYWSKLEFPFSSNGAYSAKGQDSNDHWLFNQS